MAIVFHSPEQSEAGDTRTSADRPPAPQISPAQRRVLVALTRPFRDPGKMASPPTNQQIAQELFLSVDAVKTHIRNLFQRFAVEDLPQNQKRLRLIELALDSGAVTRDELENRG